MQVVHTFLCFHSRFSGSQARWLCAALCVCVCVCMQFACPRALWFLIYRQTSGQRARQGPRHCGRHVSATEAPRSQSPPESPRQSWSFHFSLNFFYLLFHLQSVCLSLCLAVFLQAPRRFCRAASHSMAAIVVAGIRAMADGSSLSSLL